MNKRQLANGKIIVWQEGEQTIIHHQNRMFTLALTVQEAQDLKAWLIEISPTFEDLWQKEHERALAQPVTYKGHTLKEALVVLQDAGFKDVTKEANTQNKREDFAAFESPIIDGCNSTHYCEFDYDVIELALDQELLDTANVHSHTSP